MYTELHEENRCASPCLCDSVVINFSYKYPKVETIKLHSNYRSTQHVLDTAHSLIQHNILPEGHTHTELVAHAPHESRPIDIVTCKNQEIEVEFVLQSLRKNIQEGVDPSHIAILYRANSNAERANERSPFSDSA